MNNLLDFLTDIAINPKKQIAFAQQPDKIMVAAGLSKVEQVIIESKNSEEIAAIFADHSTPLATICGDPTPEDPLPDPDPPSEPDPEPLDISKKESQRQAGCLPHKSYWTGLLE